MTPNIDLLMNLTVNPGSHLYCTSGLLQMIGTSIQQIIDFTNTDSYFNDLRIGNVTQLNSIIRARGNLYIDLPSGHLMTMGNTIWLSGDYWNYMGSPFFDPTGRIVFDGVLDQHIHTPLPRWSTAISMTTPAARLRSWTAYLPRTN